MKGYELLFIIKSGDVEKSSLEVYKVQAGPQSSVTNLHPPQFTRKTTAYKTSRQRSRPLLNMLPTHLPRMFISTRSKSLRSRQYFIRHIVKVNKELGEGTLKDFNLGYLMQLPLAGLKCICGKPLGHDPNHAICAACGMVLDC